MAKKQQGGNLVSQGDRTIEERRRIASAGGKASVAKKRQRKSVREALEAFLESDASSAGAREILQGLNAKTGTNSDAVAGAILRGALEGNPAIIKILLDVIGESGSEKRAEAANKREAKRLEMEVADFEQRHAGNTADNDAVLAYIEGMTHGQDTAESQAD